MRLAHTINCFWFQTYCPFSRHASNVLIKYSIYPLPLFIDLDLRDDGLIIQKILAEFTYRRTVPNILVNWQPFGGADEISLAHSEGTLHRKLQEAGVVIEG